MTRLCGSSSGQVTLWQYSITISQIHLAFPVEELLFRLLPTRAATHCRPLRFVCRLKRHGLAQKALRNDAQKFDQ